MNLSVSVRLRVSMSHRFLFGGELASNHTVHMNHSVRVDVFESGGSNTLIHSVMQSKSTGASLPFRGRGPTLRPVCLQVVSLNDFLPTTWKD